MKKFILFIFCVLVTGIFIIAFIFYEKPAQEDAKKMYYNNFSLKAFNYSSKQSIDAHYYLKSDKMIERFGETTKESYVLEVVPTNDSYDILFYEDGFYSQFYAYNLNNMKESTYRVSGDLIPFGEIKIIPIGNFLQLNSMNVLLVKEGEFRMNMLCIRWGTNIMTASIESKQRVEPPSRLTGKVDKCYHIQNETQVILNYARYNGVAIDDYIRIVAIDEDYTIDNPSLLVNEDTKGVDVGKKDVSILIK